MARFVFVANDGTNGTQLWSTDGTAGGTLRISALAGTNANTFLGLDAVSIGGNNFVLFGAELNGLGRELWSVQSGFFPSLVQDINPGAGGSAPGLASGFHVTHRGQVFAADNGASGPELWVTDVQSPGQTRLLADINPGSGGSSPSSFTRLADGRLVFSAENGSQGRELWVTDGGAAGTSLLRDINPGGAGSDPTGFTALADGRLLFTATTASLGRELWVTDGTAAGTSLLRDFAPYDQAGNPRSFTALPDGRVAFIAETVAGDATSTRLWITDGTAAGTTEAVFGSFLAQAGGFSILADGRAIFRAPLAGTNGFWVTDFTQAGTKPLVDPFPNPLHIVPVSELTPVANNRFVFAANPTSAGVELWVTNGTAAGTSFLSSVATTTAFSGTLELTSLLDGRAVFRNAAGGTGAELWVTDGTAAGTRLVRDINPGEAGGNPAYFTLLLGAPAASFNLVAPTAPFAEGQAQGTTITLTLTRSGDLAHAAGVDWFVADRFYGAGYTADRSDFQGATLPSGHVTFAPYQASRTISLQLAGDAVLEGDETFGLWLNGASGGTIGTSRVTVTIRNDDALLAIAGPAAPVSEGQSGATPVTFTVTRTGDLSSVVSADWTVTGIGGAKADAADFPGGVLPSGRVSFAAGVASQSITILVAGDTAVEGDEAFRVTLSNPANATFAADTADATIRTDDAGLRITGPGSIAEGNSGSTAFTFTVARNGDVSGASSLAWAVTGSGARPADAADFVGGVLPGGTISFAPGETSRTITLQVAGDLTVEASESFTVTLADAVGAQILTASAAATIVADDKGVTLTGPASITEGIGANRLATYEVTRSGDLTGSVSIAWAVTGSGAHPVTAADFIGNLLPSGSFTLSAQVNQFISLNIRSDADAEFDEGLTLSITASPGVAVLNGSVSTTLLTDDTGIAISGPTAAIAEGDAGGTPVSFTVTRIGDLSRAVTLPWTVVAGGTDAADFLGGALPRGMVSFAIGETSRSITLDLAGDRAVEGDETFSVLLGGVGGVTLTEASAAVTIRNDDAELSIAGPAAPIAEGHAGGTAFTFTVTRAGDLSRAASADWAVTGSGANPADATDFLGGALPRGRVDFAAGEATRTITLQVAGDTSPESDESFALTLSNPVGAGLGTASATATIRADDTAWAVTGPTAPILEGNGGNSTALFTVTRTGDLSSAFSGWVSLAGSGPNPTDWPDHLGGSYGTLPHGAFTLAPGEAGRVVPVYIVGDVLAEADEGYTFFLTAGGRTGPVLASASAIVANDDTNLRITPQVNSYTEGNDGTRLIEVTVLREGILTGATSARWSVTPNDFGGLAAAVTAADFAGGVLPSGVVTFAPGETSKTISFGLADDGLVERPELFAVEFSDLVGATLNPLAFNSMLGSIRDDDGAVSITGPLAPVAEGNAGTTPVTFTISRTGRDEGQSVAWALTGSGANPATASDFAGGLLPTGVITFADGEVSRSITIRFAGDRIIEADEGFTITLSNPVNTRLGTASAEASIRNDDWALALAGPASPIAEGDAGATPFTFTVTRSGDLSGSVTGTWRVAGASANPADGMDFQGGALPSGSVIFAPGEASRSITVPVAGDSLAEADEGFTLMLSYDAGGGTTTLSAGAVIRADDTALSLTGPAAPVAEGTAGGSTLTFTVTRTGDLSGSSSADWAVSPQGGNSANAADFAGGLLPSGTIAFAPGEASRSITVQLAGDTAVEANETFALTLSNPLGTAIAAGRAVAIIRNDDSGLSLSGPAAPVTEGQGGISLASFTVTRSGDLSGSATALWSVAGSGVQAADAADFAGGVLPTGQVSFAAGQASQLITLALAGDQALEADEGLTLTLASPVGTILEQASATAVIRNDDAELSLSGPAAAVLEGSGTGGAVTFTVTRTGDLSRAASAQWSVAGSGAAAATAADFAGGVLPTGLVGFAAGEASRSITVHLAGDSLFEADEGFTLTLAQPVGASLATATASAVIGNDDAGLVLSAPVVSLVEGQSGWTNLHFTVLRLGNSQGSVTADWSFAGLGPNPADAADFLPGQALSGSITLAPGQPDARITLQLRGDDDFEANEVLAVTLSNLVGATMAQPSASLTILNDDSSLSIAGGAAVQGEGQSGTTLFTFTVTREGDASRYALATWTVTGFGLNPAEASDFAGGAMPQGPVVFEAGETVKTITIAVAGDRVVEGDEGFLVTLSHPFQVGIAQAVAGGIIREDDGPAPRLVFSADDGPRENELWVTDTTEAGTSLLRDLMPAGSSFPYDFVALGDGRVVFTATEASLGRELWVTDGTAGGTQRVARLRQGDDPDSLGSDPREFARLGDGRLVFSADDGISGRELWVTDGTAGGTSRVADLYPGEDGGRPSGLTAMPDGRVLFDSATHGTMVTDGTAAGTFVLTEYGLDPFARTARLADGRLLFGALSDPTTELWVTDGTPGGTSLFTARDAVTGAELRLSDLWDIASLPDGRVMLSARGDAAGNELWVTDGTAAGTARIADLRAGPGSSRAEEFTLARDGRLVFSANDGAHGRELWVTDGTAGGTSLLADIAPGDASGHPQGFTALGDGRLVFSAGNFSSGTELWVTDGTAAGTSLLRDIHVAGSGSSGLPGEFTALNDGRVVFAAYDSQGRELWITDGTEAGTGLVRDIDPGAPNGFPAGFTALGSALSVSGPASVTEGHSGGTTLTFTVTRTGLTSGAASVAWSVAGSGANPADAADFAGGVLPSGVVSFSAGQTSRTITLQVAGDRLHEANEGFTLTLAEPVGATLLRPTASVSLLNDDVGLAIAGPDRVAEGLSGATSVTFTVTRLGSATGTASADWAVTGSGATPALANDFAGGALPSGTVTFAVGETSRTITIQIAGDALTEPDEGFTVTLSNPSGASLVTASAASVIANDDTALRFVFLGFEPGAGAELWVTDGTPAGTSLVLDSSPAEAGLGLTPQHLTGLADGRVVFSGLSGSLATAVERELWVSDGTAAGTSLLLDINPGGASNPEGFTRLPDGRLVFAADDGAHGNELWVTDGTAAGTTRLSDIAPGAGSPYPAGLTALGNGRIVFQASDGSTGPELWATDGTAAGTQRLADLRPGAAGGLPAEFTLLGDGRAVFAANASRQDRELWVTDGTAAGTSLVKDILPGTLGSEPTGFAALADGRVVFSAPTLGQLWVTDGSAAGTSSLADVAVAVASARPEASFAALAGGRLIFRGEDAQGLELWVTDGTAAGTSLLADINPGGDAFRAEYFDGFGRLADGRVVFSADDGTHGTELWITDGTAAGTSLVADLFPTSYGIAYGSDPRDFTALPDGRVLFGANDGTGAAGGAIWVTDGTAAGTVRLGEVLAGLNTSAYPAGFTPLNTTRISAPARVAEALEGSTALTFTLTRSGDVTGAALVTWAVRGTGANPASGADFPGGALPGGQVSFAAGEASRSVTIQIAGDRLAEATEGFAIRLLEGIGTNLGITEASVLIDNAVQPNRVPVVTSPRAVTFAENGTGIAYQATATDADPGTTLRFFLGGADAALFTLDAAGAVRFRNAPDAETPGDIGGDNAYDLLLTVADDESGVGHAFTISVTGVNEAPSITSPAAALFAENGTGIAWQAAASDPEGDALAWSLGGADAALFSVDAAGAVRFLAAPDFEAPRGALYTLTLIASDGALSASQALAITVTDGNEAPVITSAATASFAENGTGAVHQALAKDPDAGASLSWALGGVDAALFTLDAAGLLRFKAAPNFEAPADADGDNAYDVTLIASDGALGASQALRVQVSDVNEAPRVTSGATASFAENGTGIAYQGIATDPDAGASLSWSLGGADAALFTVDAMGAVRFRLPPDFETPRDAGGDNGYAISLIASDGQLTSRRALVIQVTDQAEAPVFTSAGSASFAENGTGIAYQGQAMAPDAGRSLTWSLEGADAGLFTVDATGAVRFVTAPDFEAPGDAGGNNDHVVTLVIIDGHHRVEKAITIQVTDVNEAPVITSAAPASVLENSAGIAHQASARDPDAGTTLAWSLAGADAALFTVDAAGAIRFIEAPDFEAPRDADADNAYQLTLIASDGALGTDQALTITVAGVNEAPRITSGGTASFSENGTGIVLQAGASDPDAGTTLTWSLAGADADLFTLDATGAIRFRAAPDFETPRDAGADNIHDLRLRVSDGERVTEQAITITVLDVPEVVKASGGSGNDLLAGGPLGDVLIGRAGQDTLLGLTGDDRLEGGAGADRMEGGAGNDRYTVDDLGDLVLELDGEGLDLVTSSISYGLPGAVERLILSGGAALSGTGNALDNLITGNAAGNLLSGEAGADTLRGGNGDDTLLGGEGNDSLDGGAGADQMQGGAGDDRYVVDHAGDTVLELAGGGLDLVLTSVSFTLGAELEQLTLTGAAQEGHGNALANRITGHAGDNLLTGGAGDDTLLGGAGADTLIGGLGQDRLQGQAGADIFRYLALEESPAGPAARDVIVDFSAAGGDLLDLTALDANSLLGGDQGFTWIGAGTFTGVAGQLRHAGGLLAADVNGDGLADFEIAMAAPSPASIWL